MKPKKWNGISMRTALWLSIVCLGMATPLHGNDPLQIAVSPEFSFAPSTLRVRVRVERSAENRAIEVIADGDDYYRSSEVGLNGDAAPSTVELRLRSVPSGRYQVFAVLKDGAGRERARVGREVTVMGVGDVN